MHQAKPLQQGEPARRRAARDDADEGRRPRAEARRPRSRRDEQRLRDALMDPQAWRQSGRPGR